MNKTLFAVSLVLVSSTMGENVMEIPKRTMFVVGDQSYPYPSGFDFSTPVELPDFDNDMDEDSMRVNPEILKDWDPYSGYIISQDSFNHLFGEENFVALDQGVEQEDDGVDVMKLLGKSREGSFTCWKKAYYNGKGNGLYWCNEGEDKSGIWCMKKC